jgi:hypothetical protein
MNVEGGGSQSANWGSGIDNLAFDNQGNLWAQQDGGNGHIWVIRPDHTPFAPRVDIFATTPSGSESSGLTITPDYRQGFLSIMGASGSNSTAAIDATGTPIIFNQSNTVVIANKYFLGSLAAVPVEFASFQVNRSGKNNVFVNWTTASEINNEYFDIQRSIDGVNFENIQRVNGAGNSNNTKSYNYDDMGLKPAVYYYRIKQVDYDGMFAYSQIRTVNLTEENILNVNQIYPNPFGAELNITINTTKSGTVTVTLFDINGREVSTTAYGAIEGIQTLNLNTNQLENGLYIVEISTMGEKHIQKLVK